MITGGKTIPGGEASWNSAAAERERWLRMMTRPPVEEDVSGIDPAVDGDCDGGDTTSNDSTYGE